MATSTRLSRPLSLNADVGELPTRVFSDDEDTLIGLIDEANVACGGHAGSADTMRLTLQRCLRHGVKVSAHPSYPDVRGFGRTRLLIDSLTLRASLSEQILDLWRIAQEVGVDIDFIKPHGALYHAIGEDNDVAAVMAAVVDDVASVIGRALPLVLFHQAATSEDLRARGLVVRREVFADRGTDEHGRLLPRGTPGAVLGPTAAAAAAQAFVDDAVAADTICIHGDGEQALQVARAVAAVLSGTGRRSA